MNKKITVREEATDDASRIHQVETAAFGQETEAKIVDLVRAKNGYLLSLVAELDNEVVGHIMFTPVTVENDDNTFTAAGLAPLAVMPAYQNRGVGSALIEAGLTRCREMQHLLVFVVGHVTYFPRFGFRPAVPLGFDSDYVSDDGPVGHFMVTELMAGALRGKSGYVQYRPEFKQLEGS